MKLLVITLAPTLYNNNVYSSYAPYVKEMNLWFKYVDEVSILAPTSYKKKLLTTSFDRTDIQTVSIPNIGFNNVGNAFRACINLPFIVLRMLLAMRKADHIHLRCPGNIGLIGCFVQLFFPKKIKSAKYAGNWDPNAEQPISYKLQKWILGNTFWTKNMKVLVYGLWPNQSSNIAPFFTASYRKDKINESEQRKIVSPFRFVFVGSLSPGKRPLYAVKLIKALLDIGVKCSLDIYGDGDQREVLETYVEENGLMNNVILHGNQEASVVEQAYKKSEFMLLPSKSEGWPKVVAEAMFWGAIPIVTKISCVPWMLDNGTRGILLDFDLQNDINVLVRELLDSKKMQTMSQNGQAWSQQYTLDDFEAEIQKIL